MTPTTAQPCYFYDEIGVIRVLARLTMPRPVPNARGWWALDVAKADIRQRIGDTHTDPTITKEVWESLDMIADTEGDTFNLEMPYFPAAENKPAAMT